jgi:hypothetical protein
MPWRPIQLWDNQALPSSYRQSITSNFRAGRPLLTGRFLMLISVPTIGAGVTVPSFSHTSLSNCFSVLCGPYSVRMGTQGRSHQAPYAFLSSHWTVFTGNLTCLHESVNAVHTEAASARTGKVPRRWDRSRCIPIAVKIGTNAGVRILNAWPSARCHFWRNMRPHSKTHKICWKEQETSIGSLRWCRRPAANYCSVSQFVSEACWKEGETKAVTGLTES